MARRSQCDQRRGRATTVTGTDIRLAAIQELAGGAMDRLASLGVAPTPENYRLWFSHLAGDHPDLSRAVDDLLKSGGALDEDRFADLYERYFSANGEAQAIVDTGRRLHQLLESLQDQIATVGQDTAHYNVTLGRAQSRVARERDANLSGLVQDLLNETLQMQHRALQLQDQLCATSTTCAELRRELRAAQLAGLTDPLTGIANRSHFDKVARAAVARARTARAKLSLLLADVDHLTRFNGRYGPVLGDDVLRLVATSLKRCAGETDLVARYGGGQFAVVMPGRDLGEACGLADRARAEMAAREQQLRRAGTRIARITLSVGVVELAGEEGARSWIERAGDALCEAKRAGRDRVVALPRGLPLG